MKIEIDVEDYIELLEDRRKYHQPVRDMPDCLWDYFMDNIRECGMGEETNPKYVVDNAMIGDYGYFDDYKEDDETDEDFIKRVEDEVFYINADERVVCFHL